MNNKAINVMAFALGAGLASAVLWRYFKQKYEKIAQKEIASVKETFSKRQKAEAKKQEEKTVADEYTSTLRKEGYITPSGEGWEYYGGGGWNRFSKHDANEKKEEKTVDKPYVISPDEFGEFDEYERITLTYYADQLLADEDDELVEDVDKTVGFESFNHFGEYEEDCVFVRNDGLCCDYEILLDERNYMDIIKQRPPKEGAY